MKRLAVWGWWQGHNLGDNWIKHILSKIFPEAEFIDTSVMNFDKYDFVICGGGGLFIRDVIAPWNNYLNNTPFGMFGLGAEFPHKSCTALELKDKAVFFFLRDNYSLECMKIKDVDRSYDITFAYPMNRTNIDGMNNNKVCLIWRDGRDLYNQFPDFHDYIDYEDKYDEYIKLLSCHFSQIKVDDFQTSDYDAEKVIGDSGFIVSGRFHGIVAAIQKGIPCIAIDICPKIRVLMKDCGLEKYCIKVNQTYLLPELIDDAKKNINEIRDLQKRYSANAKTVLNNNIIYMRKAIFG